MAAGAQTNIHFWCICDCNHFLVVQLGKMAEANYMLSKAEKGKDAMKKYPVMALSMCVQRLLVIERQRASELEKKLHLAEEEILQLKQLMGGSKGEVAAVNAAEE